MPARLSAFVIWALVAAAAVFWALRLGASPIATPAHAGTVSTAAAARGDLARLLGSPPATVAPVEVVPDAAGRFKLIGVMAPRGASLPSAVPSPAASVPAGSDSAGRIAGQGVALISVDGKPPRPYRVGASIEGEFVLQAVAARGVSIRNASSAQAPMIRLELPPLPAPATGQLPPVSLNPASGSPPVPPPAAPVVPPSAVMPAVPTQPPQPAAPVATDVNAPPPAYTLPPGVPPAQAR
jgi:general secretion pathway protein C